VVLRARNIAEKILARRVPVYMLILAVVLTALVTFSVYYAQVPPASQIINALRPKIVTVYIADVTFQSIELRDNNNNDKADQAVVRFSIDRAVDEAVRVTVTLKAADGTTLDSWYTTISIPAADSYTVIVYLSDTVAMNAVKSIEIAFTTEE
jgi:hypothetical protein